jgi:DNA-binding response OmpR family regulator
MRVKLGMNILLVDDEESVTALLKMVLMSMGHFVDAVHSVEDALSKLTGSPDRYHLLITDHKMPKVSGLELVKQLRVKTFKGKILVLTGYLTPELKSEYLALGVDRILEKPFNRNELRTTIEELRP